MLGFANIYSIYLSVYQLFIHYFLIKTRNVFITKFDEEPFLFPVYKFVTPLQLLSLIFTTFFLVCTMQV